MIKQDFLVGADLGPLAEVLLVMKDPEINEMDKDKDEEEIPGDDTWKE